MVVSDPVQLFIKRAHVHCMLTMFFNYAVTMKKKTIQTVKNFFGVILPPEKLIPENLKKVAGLGTSWFAEIECVCKPMHICECFIEETFKEKQYYSHFQPLTN